MADRTVSVRLQAEVGSYIAGMSKASAATMRLGDTATTTGNRSRSAFDLAGKGPLLFGGAVVAGLGMAISKSMEFERSMSGVAAATGLTGQALEDLRDTAMRAGADTQYSATEAADAIREMSKAGISAADIMGGGLDGALALAAAGQMEVADAAQLAAIAMTQFKLSGEDLPHVADLLAAGAGKAVGEVDDLGQALNQAGLVASAAGLSIEETTGTLSAFAAAGLIGSDAGTSLKTMLQRLQNPSEEAAGTMAELGVSMYDASGQFVGMEALAGQLRDGMASMTPEARDAAMAIIFGSDAVRAANVLYAEGAQGIAGWTEAVDDAGYAQEQAAALTDNLSGDLERLGGSFDTLLITIGEGAQGPLRDLVKFLGMVVDGVTWAVEAFTSLPAPLQTALILFAGYKALHGPLDSFFTMLSARITGAATGMGMAVANAGGFRGAMGGMVSSMAPAALATAGLTLGIAGISAGLAEVEAGQQRKIQHFNDLAAAMREGGRAASEAASEMEFWANSGARWVVGEQMDIAAQSARGYWDALTPVEQAQQKATEWTNNLAVALHDHGEGSEEARIAQERYAYWTGLATERQTELDGALDAATGGLATATGVTDDLSGAMALLGDTTGMTEDQIKGQQDALQAWRDNATGILASFTDPLAIYTQQMQDAATAVADSTEDSSDSWLDYVDSVGFDLDAYATSLEEQNARQEQWRADIVAITTRGGEELGNILFNMGEEGTGLVTAMVDANDEEFNRMKEGMIADARFAGEGAVRELQAQMVAMAIVGASGGQATVQGLAAQLGLGTETIRSIAAEYGITLAEGVNPILAAVGEPTMNLLRYSGPYIPNHADGGYISGPGTATSDSIPARLSNGEYVVRAASVAKYGRGFFDDVNEGILAFARGGFVSVADVPRPPGTPFSGAIASPGAGTMQKGYNAVTAWLPSHLEPPPSSGGSSTGLLPIMAAARQYAMDTYGIRNIGGFANRNIAGTKVKSDHAMGKAIDIMTSNLGLGWRVANDFAYGPAHKKFRAENVIWQQSISSNGGRFVGMEDRGSPTQNHRDHVHVDTYRTGTPYVPRDGLAYIHEGEAVVPKSINARSREFLGGTRSGSGAAAVSVNITDARIVGTLDLGGGLEGRIDGRVVSVLTELHDRGAYNP